MSGKNPKRCLTDKLPSLNVILHPFLGLTFLESSRSQPHVGFESYVGPSPSTPLPDEHASPAFHWQVSEDATLSELSEIPDIAESGGASSDGFSPSGQPQCHFIDSIHVTDELESSTERNMSTEFFIYGFDVY